MGSKRVGLARTQALLENLKRELSMGSAAMGGLLASTTTATAGTELTAADSGKIIFVTQASGTVTLPAPTADGSAGLIFHFVVVTTASADLFIDSQVDGTGIVGFLTADDGNVEGNDQKLKLNSGNAGKGDCFTLVCNGSSYFIMNGLVNAQNAVAFA